MVRTAVLLMCAGLLSGCATQGLSTGALTCEAQSAFTYGERGIDQPDVCPNTASNAYQDAYQQGRKLYVARAQLSALLDERQAREARLGELENEVTLLEAKLDDAALTSTERQALMAQIGELAQRQAQMRKRISRLGQKIEARQARLEDLEIVLAYGY